MALVGAMLGILGYRSATNNTDDLAHLERKLDRAIAACEAAETAAQDARYAAEDARPSTRIDWIWDDQLQDWRPTPAR
jgi:hypothetical protein